MKEMRIMTKLFKHTLLALITVKICFSADATAEGIFIGQEMDEYLRGKHLKSGIKTPYSAREILTQTEEEWKIKEFPPLPLDAKILVLGARPNEVSVTKDRPFMLDNPSIYFFDVWKPEAKDATSPEMKRLIRGNFDRIEEFSKCNRNKLEVIVFDWATLKFFPNSFSNFSALHNMLKPGGMLIIPSTAPAAYGIREKLPQEQDDYLHRFRNIFSAYGVFAAEITQYPNEYKKRIHNRVNNMVIQMLTLIGFECSLGLPETLQNNVGLKIILQHPIVPKKLGRAELLSNILIAIKKED